MRIESRYLAAVGDYHGNVAAARESLDGGDRSRALTYGISAAGNAMKRLFYGSILTFDYAVNARLIDHIHPDKDLKFRYGLQIGMAAGVLKHYGVELPQSFTAMIDPPLSTR